MPPREGSGVPTRRASLVATATAGGVLVVVEMAYAWAEHWYHSPEYFALSAGLTLALALAAGLLGGLVPFGTSPALALWTGACLGVSFGWPHGVAAAALTLLALRTVRSRSLAPALLGAASALALACAYLKCTAFAEHLGRKDDFLYESVGAVLLLPLTLLVVLHALRAVPERVPVPARVLGLVLVACLCAQRPRLERGDGGRRQPPEGYASSPARGAGGHPDVIVIVLDTVRADHLSLYGYGRDTTPELAELVRSRPNAVVYPHAYANGTWTVPSHGSLFTGLLPGEHGAHFALDGSVRVGFGLSEAHSTLAERMQSGGYATLAGYANHWLRSVQGMERGFDRYLRAPDRDELPFVGEALRQRLIPGVLWEAAKGCARAADVNATLLSMVEPWSRGPNPLFVFANYVDAHGPYAPPRPFRGRFAPWSPAEVSEHLSNRQSPERHAQMMARYDEEIAYLDHQLGELFRELKGMGVLDGAWVFVTADHGEAFDEHGVLEHGTTVYDEVVHVPLIVLPPLGESLTVTDAPVSLVDVTATVAAIGGVTLECAGRDLRHLEGASVHATAAEFYGDPVKASKLGVLARRPARAVWLDHYKLVAYSDACQLFDLDKDPGEHVDLASALPNLVEHMKAFLPAFADPTFASDGEAPANQALEELQGLGYVGKISSPD